MLFSTGNNPILMLAGIDIGRHLLTIRFGTMQYFMIQIQLYRRLRMLVVRPSYARHRCGVTQRVSVSSSFTRMKHQFDIMSAWQPSQVQM